ncbi:transglutaminase family protein [Neobacillus mesonae]|nr:transglutaminase family protein [Neobacillus mesonae]
MELIVESNKLDDYLSVTQEVDYTHPSIQELAEQLYKSSPSEIEFVKSAFEYVRDQINHSWDIQSSRVTCKASDVLFYQEGICYAKSNLLSAVLRSKGIPAGFCYQRLTLGDTPETGYCIHALNAVYLPSIGKWIRLDARGNKPGVEARFSLDEEHLAFPVRDFYEEIDYPVIYTAPHPKTTDVLLRHSDCIQMYLHGLPTEI